MIFLPRRWRPAPAPPALDGVPGAPDFQIIRRLRSPQLRNRRDVIVALPADWQERRAPLPVGYFQDGQNLFDPASSFAGDWGLGQTLAALSGAGLGLVAVGVANAGPQRIDEYSPFRSSQGGGRAARYLDFLLETVRPLIARNFPARLDPEGSFVAGSSMGALFSLYAHCRRPDIFGAAGVLSPSLWFAGGAIFRFLEEHPPQGRIHLDVGTAEGERPLAEVRRLRDWLAGRGAEAAGRLSYVEAAGAGHHESAWGPRLRAALPFLLGVSAPAPPRGDPSGAGHAP